MSSEIKDITMDLMVNEDIGKVLFAEVDGDFLDVLLNFLTIRLGTLNSVHDRHSNIGCIDTLLQSAIDLDEKYKRPGILHRYLFPQRLAPKTEYNKTRIGKYYCLCKEYAPWFSWNHETYCNCVIMRDLTKNDEQPKENGSDELLFLKRESKFVITDELVVKPITRNSSTLSVLSSIGVHLVGNNINFKRVSSITVKQDQVVDLFKRCLVSATPLSDIFLPLVPTKDDKQKVGNLVKSRATTSTSQQRTTQMISSRNAKSITINLLCDKINSRVLFAEAKEDFVELLGYFLRLSSSVLAYLLSKKYPFTSLYNLYRSATDLEVDKYKSEKHKSYLLGKEYCVNYFEKYITGDGAPDIVGRGLYIITDDLKVAPFSAISSMSILQKFNISMDRIEEREVYVDKEKVKKLLMNLLTSKMALTNTFLE